MDEDRVGEFRVWMRVGWIDTIDHEKMEMYIHAKHTRRHDTI